MYIMPVFRLIKRISPVLTDNQMKMKTKITKFRTTTIVASLILAAFISGCKKDDYVEVPGVCPLVISTIPAKDATGVPLSQVISATFNEKMDPATITQASFTLQ